MFRLSIVLGYLLILLSPLCMGMPWVKLCGAKSTFTELCFAYIAGYFMRMTLFHAVALPMTILGMHFSFMADVFTVLLVLGSAISLGIGWKKLRRNRKRRKKTVFERIYLAIFVGMLLLQVLLTVIMDPTTMSYDDSSYTVYSSDALATDYMFITNPQTGLYEQLSYRMIQSALLFPAYISRLTGMPVTVVEHTFSYGVNLLLAYGCYILMSEDLYKKWEDSFVFLILISAIYFFGYHSHYSMAFRLLGPNSQGKAILAVTLVPLLFVLLRKWLDQPYQGKCGFFLFFLSDAGCALSLMGTVYVLAIVALLTGLSMFRRQRKWKHLLYILWTGMMPGLYVATFILLRNLL